MPETDADKHSAELAAARSSQHLSAWLLAILLLVLLVLGVYHIVQINDQNTRIESIGQHLTGIERRLNELQRKNAPPDAPKPGD